MTDLESQLNSPDRILSRDHLVAEIRISRLFGRYSYHISPLGAEEIEQGAPPLMLLYGQNGGGKTTILKMIWHILSPADDRGHRTALSAIPFQSCGITLGNGHTISVTRPEGTFTGSFAISVVNSEGELVVEQPYVYAPNIDAVRGARRLAESEKKFLISTGNATFSADDGSVIYVEEPEDDYIMYLRQLNARPFMLSDDRRMRFDEMNPRRRERLNALERERLRDLDSPISAELGAAVTQTNEWFRQQIFSGSDAGSLSVDEIYRDVIRHLASDSRSSDVTDISVVRKRLVDVEARTKKFSEFGLVPPLNAKPFLELLSHAHIPRLGLIEKILDPYLSGQSARMDSLQPIESLLRIVIKNVNGYLYDKYAIFTPRGGLEIRSHDGPRLAPSKLSSGERQLLLLLCNALLARQETSLFLIDEPELSLNAKWQRRLVGTLLDFVEGSSVQFILATHSIEIITRHKSYLARLDNRVDETDE